MRALALWLLLASTANAATIGEIYLDQAAKMVALKRSCGQEYAYNDYMDLLNKVMREYEIDFPYAQDKVDQAAREVGAKGCGNF